MSMKFPIERFREAATPLYYYDMELLEQTLDKIKESTSRYGFNVHYAMKANANPAILRRISEAGFGADTVSGGEIAAAINAGFKADDIVFAGVGKTDAEIRLGLREGIGCFNVESAQELEIIEQLAIEEGKVARVALRINPNIDAHTHHYITTGLEENKFGLDISVVPQMIQKCMRSKALSFVGLHFHIGSQITTLEPYRLLCERINAIQDDLERQGMTSIKSINVGGGLGIDYDDPDKHPIADFDPYFALFHNHLKLRDGQQLHFELGRAVVAQCGSLITRVIYVKEGIGKRFAIVDAGMTDLIRPALYQAHHKIENLTGAGRELRQYDVVGPICESSDVFGHDEMLPEVHRGDLIALRSAGAYGEVMASRYNLRSLPGCMAE